MHTIIRILSIIFLTLTINFAYAKNDKLTIGLDWFINPDHAPLIIAEKRGFFKEVGLDVEMIEPADPNDPPKLVAAGRTDAGVHALGQVAHVNLSKIWDPFRLSEAINFNLKPHPISIICAAEVEADWHARFSAINRYYIFKLIVRRAPLTHHKNLVWHIKHKLDLGLMQEGAAFLVGTHDFTTFRSTLCQANSPIRTIDSIEINKIKRE